MKEKLDAQTRRDPGASFAIDNREPVLSARFAEERSRVSGQELTKVEECAHADHVRKAKTREVGAWERFKVSSPVKMGAESKEMVDTRWVPTRKEVDGVWTVRARTMAKGYQDPDPSNGNVDIAGCVSRGSPRPQLTPRGALKKWPFWSAGIKNSVLQANGFDREVSLRTACDWNSKDASRAWKLREPACGLNGAPGTYRRPSRKYLVNSAESPSMLGPRFRASSFDPRLFFFRKSRGVVGAIITHFDDVLGRD